MNISAKELRVGNILADEGSVPFRVLPMDILALYQIKQASKASIAHNPVPLTEEWLRKFGFGKIIGWFLNIDDTKHRKIELAENDDTAQKQWYCYLRNENDPSIEADDFVLLRKDLKYVHQLQNLIFAITGSELIEAKEKQ